MGPRHDLSFCACTTAWLAPEKLGSMGSSPHLWFCAFKTATYDHNCLFLWVPDLACDFLYAKSVPSIRITSLYGSQPSSVVFACKTATFGPWSQVSMCPRHHLLFCACNAVWLAPELHVSMGSSPSLWFLHSKQRLLEQNYKSVWDPDLTWRFVHANLRD